MLVSITNQLWNFSFQTQRQIQIQNKTNKQTKMYCTILNYPFVWLINLVKTNDMKWKWMNCENWNEMKMSLIQNDIKITQK